MLLRGLMYLLTGDERIAETSIGPRGTGAVPIMRLTDPADADWLRQLAGDYLRVPRHEPKGPFAPINLSPEARSRVPRSILLATGIDLNADEVEYWTEELGIDPLARGVNGDEALRDGARDFRVLVIGAGFGGIAAAIHLQAAGIPYTVLEKNAAEGGVWYENRYPGARVDTQSQAYTHVFGVDFPLDYYFNPQPECEKYANWCIDRYVDRANFQFQTEVTSLTWDAEDKQWIIQATRSDGAEVTLQANLVIAATGLLSRPDVPYFDGAEGFSGPAFHTAEWEPDFDPSGKRIAVIGAAASGLQLTPSLADMGADVVIFQRTPSWIFPAPLWNKEIPSEIKWLREKFPGYRNFDRLLTIWLYGDRIAAPTYYRDPDWHDVNSISRVNARAREVALKHLQTRMRDRPELIDQLTPRYPVMARRAILDTGFLECIAEGRARLVSAGVGRLTENSVVAGDGTSYEVDAVIYATGFRANDFLWPLKVQGRHGATLEQLWAKDGARAYLGTMLPDFPNFFLIYGPNTNANQGTIPTMGSELVVRYAIKCIKHLIATSRRAVSVSKEAYTSYNNELDRRLEGTAYMDPRAKSYYRNEFGRSATQSPWLTQEYWNMTRDPNLDELEVE
jgi:4-hydroxyacetophenone monooxygenase